MEKPFSPCPSCGGNMYDGAEHWGSTYIPPTGTFKRVARRFIGPVADDKGALWETWEPGAIEYYVDRQPVDKATWQAARSSAVIDTVRGPLDKP